MEEMKSSKLTYKQRREVDLYLKPILVQGDDGYWEYLHNETDQTVADRFGYKKHHIRYIREQAYGLLRPARTPGNLEQRVHAIEALLDLQYPGWRDAKPGHRRDSLSTLFGGPEV